MGVDPGPALNVSPVIRAGRWGFLIAGILYGLQKHAILGAMERRRREKRDALLLAQAPQRAKEKQAKTEREINEIVYLIMPPGPPKGSSGSCPC